jgi:choline dehydrogenase-like flavoprotein
VAITRRQVVLGGVAAAAFGGLTSCRRDDPGGGDAAAAPGPDLDERYDVCVIGSGFAGTFLALRTAEAGLRTIVVEAGSQRGEHAFADDPARAFRFSTSGAIEYPVNSARLIAVGGASGHWTGFVNRMRPSDFRLRSEFDLDVDWPLAYADLEPYYCRAEQALAVNGHTPVEGAEPPRNCPYPVRAPDPYRPPRVRFEGAPVRMFPVARSRRDGEPLRLGLREVPAFRDSPNGHRLAEHRAIRLVPRDRRTVDHLEVRPLDGAPKRIRARWFVVAAGVVESARLLLLARSDGFPQGLGNARDLLGRYFLGHVTVNWQFAPRRVDGLYPGTYRSYDFHDAFRSHGLGACHYQLFVSETQQVVWKLQPEMEARLENRISLSSVETDAWGVPIPDLALAFSERDRRTLAEGERFLRAQAQALNADPAGIGRRATWRAHPSGTCRMGFDESGGVVDRDNRVFALDNLYVSGVGTFPTSGTANPTLTVVALTLRLADHLVARASRAHA